jgi:pimeloyl-ACP methyl ester carboxylesterase
MRVRIGDVSLYFDVDGCRLVPYGPDTVLDSVMPGDAADRMRRIRWNPEVLEHFRQALADTFDPWSGLDQVTCPTMILADEHDPVATASAARRDAAELPGAGLHVLPGAGHGIFREDPERACALLQEFLMGNRVDANARVS